MKKILLGIVAIALIACLVGSASACTGPALTPGFWKHNVGVYLTSIRVLTGADKVNGAFGNPVYTEGTPLVTQANMATFLSQWTPSMLLIQYNRLSMQGGGTSGAITRNNAANFFNGAAGLQLLPVSVSNL